MGELSVGVKIWGDIANLVKSLTKGKEEVKTFTRGTDYAFKDLTKSVSIAENKFKQFAVQLGVNSKEAQGALREYHKLKGELNSINQSLRPQKTQQSMFTGMVSELKSTAAGFIGVSAAIGIATKALSSMVAGAMEDERAEKRLSAAVDGNAASLQRLLSWKDRMMQSTLFSEDEIMSAVTMGVELGRTEAQSKKMVTAAMGLSQVTGMDLNTAMLQLSGTFEGNLGRLTRYIPEIKNLTQAQLESGEAVELFNQKFGKLASEGLNTTQGQITQAKKMIEEFGDSIGSWLIQQTGKAIVNLKAFWFAMHGGGSVGVAEAKARATLSKQIADHEDKISEIWAKVEQRGNPMLDRLREQVQLEEAAAEAAKVTAAEKQKELQAWGAYLNFRAQGGMGPAASFGQMGQGNESINRIKPSTGLQPVTGTVNTTKQTPGPLGSSSVKTTLGDWMDAIDQVAAKAQGLDSVWQNVFRSFSTLAAKVSTGFKNGWKDAMSTIGEAVQAGIAVISQLFTQSTDRRISELDAYYESEREKIEGSRMNEKSKAKAIEKLETETATKRKVLMREQAKQQRTASLMQAIVAGALAVVQAFASGPGIGVVLGLLMTGLVAAQIATIASQPLPALAQGGLASAPTLALVGDNPNARIDPEVISPLSKLKDMIGLNDQGEQSLSVRLSGDDLLFVLERAQRSKLRRY